MDNQGFKSEKNSPSSAGPQMTSFTGNGPKKVNLLSVGHKRRGRGWKIFFLLLGLSVIALVGWVSLRAASLSERIFVGTKTSFVQKVKDFIMGANGSLQLRSGNDGQINILLLGIGGEGHDGPYLSDTMIVAQVRPQNSEVVLTSIPRDLLVDMPNGIGQEKINAAFSEGFVRSNHDWNTAGTWARQVVEQVSGLQIPYFAVMDFSGFKKAVDTVGGVDVKIDRSFTDNSYPADEGTGYLPPVTFTAGTEHMTGARALEFSRSRHAAGLEGSDFARSLRQQKVLNALKDRVGNLNLISNSGKLNALLDVVADHFHTNMSPGEIFSLYQTIRSQNIHNFLSLSLDPDTQLVCPEILPTNGAYVLVPCPGKTAKDVQNFFKDSLARARLAQENPVIWLATSTGDRLAYQRADALLKNQGLTVWELTYSKDSLPKTIFYLVNPEPATAAFLTNEFNASEVTLPPPQVNIDKAKVDVILILGQDFSSSSKIIEPQ